MLFTENGKEKGEKEMAIELNELINKKHKDGKCVAFDYNLQISENAWLRFEFVNPTSTTWVMTSIDKCCEIDYVYHVIFNMPKSNMDLTMVCSFGLNLFRSDCMKELDKRNALQFLIGEIISGMEG